MDLSIIIPSFNTKKLLKGCIDSIKKNREDLKLETIVVDNGSTDSSVDYLQTVADGKEVQAIFLDQNYGFAKAVNRGIKKARGEYILLLNSDIVVKQGAIKKIVDFAKTHPLAGVIGGRLLTPDGAVQPSVYHFPTVLRAVREFWLGQKDTYQKYTPRSNQPEVVDAVTGAAMLIPRETIDKVGLLDERYFIYFEDLDYCRRVKQAGYKTYYLPSAQFVHYHGASGEKIPELTHQWLVESSKLYNGLVKYYLLTLVIWSGQKWQRLRGKLS